MNLYDYASWRWVASRPDPWAQKGEGQATLPYYLASS